MQINRLFEIIYLLLEKNSVTATELAEHFEVSTRTIYRDVDTLSSAGIPVYAARGKGGGIRLLPDYVLNKTFLSDAEQTEILSALGTLSVVPSDDTAALLRRLRSLFQKEQRDWIEVDFSGWSSGAGEREKFDLLKAAILERQVIDFIYYNSCGKNSIRQAEPVKLHFKGQAWYLQAYCLHRQAYRSFKISRMQELKKTGRFFQPRSLPLPPMDVGVWGNGRPAELKLWLSPQTAYRLYDLFHPDQIHKNDDGSFLVTAYFHEDDWAYGFLLSLGDQVKILSPTSFAKKLREKAEKIQKMYGEVL